MSRLRTLHALAWSLPDVEPAPKVASSGASRGEVADSWRMCDTCDGEGEVRDRFGRVSVCGSCGGKRRFRVDSMTGGRVSTAEHPAPSRTRRVLCDRCGGGGVMPGRYVGETGLVRCDMCDGSGKVSVPAVETEPKGKAFDGTARSRLRARGDWDALEDALGLLHGAEPLGWRLWMGARVYGWPVEERVEPALQATDMWLLMRLPDPLRCPRDVITAFEERKQRADQREAHRKARSGRGSKRSRAAELLRMGYPVQEAARLAGCSVKTARRAAA